MKRSDRPLNLTYFGNTISYDLQNFKSVLLVGFPDLENHPLIDGYTTSCESNGTQTYEVHGRDNDQRTGLMYPLGQAF